MARSTPIQRLPAAVKLCMVGLLALADLINSRLTAALILVLIWFLLYALARLGWRQMLQDARVVLYQAPLVVAVLLLRQGMAALPAALLVSIRLGLLCLPGLWLQRTTRVSDILAVFGRFLPSRLAFVITMSLHFVPLITREAREIYWLQQLRGARVAPRQLINPLCWAEWCRCLAIPIFMRALHLADEVSVAARQRGIGEDTPAQPTLRSQLICRKVHP
ncbi:MAG: energy-coupling factor transporter transmembrane component T [Acidobacteriota bacterium]|nr:energy-coupling factor transporter transmembrane component T [Acidobacteriota bacterium]